MRKQRKQEHVESYLKSEYEGDTLFEDVFLFNNSLPELNFEDIDMSTEFLGKKVDYPIMINAMTGGAEFAEEINRDLAILAKEFNIPMAVGSQTITLSDEEGCCESFMVVRETMDKGVVLGNLSGHASVEDAKKAVDLIDADGLQIHLNPAQEMAMLEGDRDFTGVLKNVEAIVKNLDKPVVVKEVGFGMSKDVVKRLQDVGVKNIDISGSGGTNFIEIENSRCNTMDFSEFYSWGIPTALSIINANEVRNEGVTLIASGGVKTATDVIKSLVLGADMVGISGEILSYLMHGGFGTAKEYLELIIYKMKVLMMMLGAKDLAELKKNEYKITGKLKDLL